MLGNQRDLPAMPMAMAYTCRTSTSQTVIGCLRIVTVRTRSASVSDPTADSAVRQASSHNPIISARDKFRSTNSPSRSKRLLPVTSKKIRKPRHHIPMRMLHDRRNRILPRIDPHMQPRIIHLPSRLSPIPLCLGKFSFTTDKQCSISHESSSQSPVGWAPPTIRQFARIGGQCPFTCATSLSAALRQPPTAGLAGLSLCWE